MSTTEIIAALLGVANIALLVRRSIWNYPFGLLMVVLYGFVFFHARLYSDTILQAYFFIVQLYGLWNWLHGRNDDGLVRVESLRPRERALWSGATLAAALAIGWFFSTYTNAAAPWLDATIAALSVTAQVLLSLRRIENWILWIAADVIAVGLYFWKGLYPTTALYAVFLGFSVAGLIAWQREQQAHDASSVLGETPA